MMATAARRTANPDVIVVGLGAVGSSTLLALARMGISALGIDRHSPPHSLGSSHGDTRITRLAVGEGAEYAPLAARSHELWQQLEGEVGVVGNDDDDGGEERRRLYLRTGGLVVGRPTTTRPRRGGREHPSPPPPPSSFVERTIDVARERGIPHEVLDANGMRGRWPQIGSGLEGDEVGCHEPSAGVLFPERCVRAQLGLAVRLGARTMLGTAVRSVSSDDEDGGGGGGVRVGGDFVAARAIVAPGAWASDLVPSLAPLTRVRRQAMHWFPLKDAEAYSPERFPVFIWHHGSGVGDYFYGFPCLPGEVSMKMATEQCDVDTTADEVDRRVDAVESDEFYERHVERRLGGVSSSAVRSIACMYTVTPDGGFVVEETSPGLIVASACSGHGFKHSAALGEALADRACGGGSGSSASAALLDPFGAGRFRWGGGETSVGNNGFCSGLGRR